MNVKAIKSAAQAGDFYDTPFHDNSKEKPDYYDIFNWSPPGREGFTAGRITGKLKEEFFDTIEKKIAYLQGVFECLSEGYGVNHGENWIQFANSSDKVERCKRWINEIYRYMKTNDKGKKLVFNGVKSHNIEYSYPICHRVELEPSVVEFIKDYQFKGEDYSI